MCRTTFSIQRRNGLIVIYSPTAQLSASTIDLSSPPTLTVGVEFGAYVCRGEKYTSLYKSDKENDHPYEDEGIPVLGEDEVVLISSLTLNDLGGLLRAMGENPFSYGGGSAKEVLGYGDFWSAVKSSYKNGLHTLIRDDTYRSIAGFESLSDSIMGSMPTDRMSDMTGVVDKLSGELLLSLRDKKGEIWDRGGLEMERELRLNEESFVTMTRLGLILRKSSYLETDHLFSDPDGNEGLAVISYRGHSKSVSLSLPEKIKGADCFEVACALWGDSSKGDALRAISPKGLEITESDFIKASNYFSEYLIQKMYR